MIAVAVAMSADALEVVARGTFVAAPGPIQRQSVVTVVVIFSPLEWNCALHSKKAKA
jgi:hypothetical protein